MTESIYWCCYDGCKYTTGEQYRLFSHYIRKHKETIESASIPEKLEAHKVKRVLLK